MLDDETDFSVVVVVEPQIVSVAEEVLWISVPQEPIYTVVEEQ